MKTKPQQLLKGSVLAILAVLSSPAHALEKPKTMEDMWKIIQAQQKQIEALQAKAAPSVASTKTESSGDVKTLERKTDVLSQEVEKLRTNLAIPEEAKYKSMYGLGPAASKVYSVGKGLSIGGYGEANYQGFVSDKNGEHNTADLERTVVYLGYKFSDNILFNSEIEFEHANSGAGAEIKGEVGVEFATLDFFLNPMANIRAGLVLMPMGIINQIHEPPFYFGNNRPMVEQFIIPTTWTEMGLGLFGQITPELTYTTYLVNGLDSSGFSADAGISGGKQDGSKVKAESVAFVGRLDYMPMAVPGLSLGTSAYAGNAGHNQTFINQQTGIGQKANVFTQLYEGHVQWKYRGLEFKALGAWGHIANADILSAAQGQTVGSSNYGWYTDIGYDVLPLMFSDTTQALLPFFRYEHYNTQATVPNGFMADLTQNKQIYQFGLNYKPIPNVVIKADYRNVSNKKGTPDPDSVNLGFGFIF